MPETELTVAGVMLHQLIQGHFMELFSDHKVNLYTYKRCCSGKKLVDWVIGQSTVTRSRKQVVDMWQALLVDGVIQHGETYPLLPLSSSVTSLLPLVPSLSSSAYL